MSSYGFLAGSYDALTQDVGYDALAGFLETLFARAKRPVRTVLDLACGTGTLTWLLAARGYETIGVDQSPEMLAQAAGKTGDGVRPMFLCQPMQRLDLYGDIDACVCCLDSVNYVTNPATLLRAFDRVHTFLAPGGVFIFDVRTPEALAAMDGQVFTDEAADVFCHWRGDYDHRRRICAWAMDIFRREGALWRREHEEHRQFAYTASELTEMLAEVGFAHVRQFGNRKLRPPRDGEDRIFFFVRKDI